MKKGEDYGEIDISYHREQRIPVLGGFLQTPARRGAGVSGVFRP